MNQKILAVAMIAAFGAGASVSALAQNDDASNNPLLEEIIVTATKREQNIYEVPVAMSAFTEDVVSLP